MKNIPKSNKQAMTNPPEEEILTAMMFKQMAELGYLDIEFTFYGCVYLNKDNKRNYIISKEENSIYRFLEESLLENVYPSPLMAYTEMRKVPAGYEEDIAQQVKHKLAVLLSQTYEEQFLLQFQQVASDSATDAAFDELESYRRSIEDRFNKMDLEVFYELVKQAHIRKVLTRKKYGYFCNWIQYVTKQMEEDLVSADVFFKTFYSSGYRDLNNKVKIFTNALPESTYRRMLNAQKDGLATSPVIKLTWQYNYTYGLVDVKNDHDEMMKHIFSEDYMQLIERIYTMHNKIDPQKFQKLYQYGEKHKEKIHEMCDYYKLLWNI